MVAACSAGSSDPIGLETAPDHVRVVVGENLCTVGVTQLRSGVSIFDVRNAHVDNASFTIIRDDEQLGELDEIAPGAVRRLVVELGRGRYQARCGLDERESAASTALTVTGRAVTSTSASSPLQAAAQRYADYIEGQAGPLQRSLAQFANALKNGHTDIAHDMLVAAGGHWERLSIVVEHTRDAPLFEAFNRDLWANKVTPQVAASADQLVNEVGRTVRDTAKKPLTALQIAQGADNVVQDFVASKGHDDVEYDATWHTTARATLEGAKAGIEALSPVLTRQDPELHEQVSEGFQALEQVSSQSPDDLYEAAKDLAQPMSDVAITVAAAARTH
jgi:iron uptake system EfeUOB component EfeO/EfeM